MDRIKVAFTKYCSSIFRSGKHCFQSLLVLSGKQKDLVSAKAFMTIKKKSVVLIGGGGHAKVVRDCLTSSNYNVIGCLTEAKGSEELYILGGDEKLDDKDFLSSHLFHVAIGDNETRLRLGQKILDLGGAVISAIHGSAVISNYAEIGDGVFIGPNAVVNASCRLENFTVVNTAASLDHDCIINTASFIGPGAVLSGGITVGVKSMIGSGANIIPNRKIGDNAIIGAGSVVITDIPANVTAVGCPAQVRKTS
jgi:sugar O-acyltransferase (sialic acid O-acetyltransferase NeuD family)